MTSKEQACLDALSTEDPALVSLYETSLAEELLRKIGFRVFLKHYFELKAGSCCLEVFSKASAKNRLFASTILFRNHLHLVALQYLTTVKTLPASLRQKAGAILALETL